MKLKQANNDTPWYDPIVSSLKKRYFDVVSQENYPKTPKLTEEADGIERAIAEIMGQAEEEIKVVKKRKSRAK